MIEVNELRIGNKILSAFNQVETVRMILGHEGYKDRTDIHKIYKYLIGVEENRNQYNLAEIKGIPVNDEWLLNMEFELEYKSEFVITYTHLKDTQIGYKWTKNRGWVVRFYDRYISCDFVHQLQNIYFELLRKEIVFIK